jgi:hypothetical protein
VRIVSNDLEIGYTRLMPSDQIIDLVGRSDELITLEFAFNINSNTNRGTAPFFHWLSSRASSRTGRKALPKTKSATLLP